MLYFSMAQYGLTSETIFEELPIVMHNMHLVNALLYELEDANVIGSEYDLLEAPVAPYLERTLNFMIENVDSVTSEQGKFQQYYKNLMRQQQQQASYLHRRQQENAQRISQGLAPFDEEDLSQNPLFKPLPEPNRLDFLLLSSQVHHYSVQAHLYAEQLHQKFVMANELGN